MKASLESPKFLGMNAKNKGFWFSFLAMMTMTIFTLIIGGFIAYPFGIVLAHETFNVSVVMSGVITLVINMLVGIPLNVKYWKYIGAC